MLPLLARRRRSCSDRSFFRPPWLCRDVDALLSISCDAASFDVRSMSTAASRAGDAGRRVARVGDAGRESVPPPPRRVLPRAASDDKRRSLAASPVNTWMSCAHMRNGVPSLMTYSNSSVVMRHREWDSKYRTTLWVMASSWSLSLFSRLTTGSAWRPTLPSSLRNSV